MSAFGQGKFGVGVGVEEFLALGRGGWIGGRGGRVGFVEGGEGRKVGGGERIGRGSAGGRKGEREGCERDTSKEGGGEERKRKLPDDGELAR